jgi:energy-coupling factor transporter ATP-binding protein EcfA2
MLLTSSLTEGEITLLLNFPRELISTTEKAMLEWITTYTSRFGKPPTLSRFSREHPIFLPVVTKDPIGDVYEQTLTRKRNLYAREYLMSVQDDLKKGKDPLPYIEELHQVIRTGASDVVRYSAYDRSSYYRKPASIPYGIPLLDQYTGGISKGDLIYLIGRLGTGKTTFALWILSKFIQREKSVLMISNENRAEDVVAKIDSYIGGFNPLKKRTNAWTDDDISRLTTVSYIASHMEGEVFIPNRPVQDMAELKSYIYTYRPDLCIVDGIYLMKSARGESHWEKITNISRNLKEIAQGEGLPILGIHQASRKAIGKHIEVEDIAYADALAQDADLVLGLNAEDDGSIFVESIKNRWGDKSWGFFVKFFFNSMTAKVLEPKAGII